MRFEIPLRQELTEELFAFWSAIFGPIADVTPDLFLGAEQEHNHNVLFVERIAGEIAGTCMVSWSKRLSGLATLGEVATDPRQRRSGISTRLCMCALEEFRDNSGKAIFLGAHNPEAARVYYRLGWRRMAGSNVMANITSGESVESFLVEYFRAQQETSVHSATPAERVPLVPLLLMPHDWHVLDANAGSRIYSTRSHLQTSCNGLFPRLEVVRQDEQGEWFVAHTKDGRTVGLTTARMVGAGDCRVDAVAHHRHMSALPELLQASADWGRARGARRCHAIISHEDSDKQNQFEALGFTSTDERIAFEMGDRVVEGRVLARSI
jgi:GNAT superfamily N-acetyltransferase